MTKDEYEDMLNDTYPEVTPLGVSWIAYGAGRVLRKMDPVAFDEMYWTFVHSMEEEEV